MKGNTYRFIKVRNQQRWYLCGQSNKGWHAIPGYGFVTSRKRCKEILAFLHHKR